MQDKHKETRRLLVTGASGFLGGHIADKAQHQYEVYAGYYNNPFSMKGIRTFYVDLTNRTSVRRTLDRIRPHVVLHCAAQSNLDHCQSHREEAAGINIDATSYLADWCGKDNVRLIFLSSDMVFDGSKSLYTETDPIHPLNYYGWTKVQAENEVRSRCTDYVIARSALIFGRPLAGGSSFSSWMEERLRNNKSISLYADQYRTPILAENGAEALIELAGSEFNGILHLGGSERIDRYSFGVKLARVLAYDSSLLRKCSMSDSNAGAPRPVDVSFCIERARKILKTKLLSVDEGLRHMREASHRTALT